MRAPPGPAWWWRHAGIPTGGAPAASPAAAPPPFPQSPLPVAVDLFMFGNWVNVTRLGTDQAGVYARDRVAVTRGRSSEAAVADPTQLAFTLNNRDGRFSPRNPTGPYYGQIGRNTQARVRVGSDVRGVGEVVAWPARWDPSGSDVWVPVQAAGILRRLQQGVAPLRSTMFRRLTSGTAILVDFTGVADPPVAYWPCEDADGSTSIASGVGGPAMSVTGTPAFAANNDFAASAALPTVGNSRWDGTIPAYTGTGTIHLDALISIPAAGTTNGAVLLRLLCTGTATQWDLRYNTAGTVTLLAYSADGTNVLTTGAITVGLNGVPMLVGLVLTQDGADVDWLVSHEPPGPASGGTSGGTLAAFTVTRALQVRVDPGLNIDSVAIGHIVVWGQNVFDEGTYLDGYAGETAGTRIARLCDEEGIAYVRVQPTHTSTAMGAQKPGKLIDLLRECEAVDQGILFEPRTFLGLSYIDRQGLYEQAAPLGDNPALALDYEAFDLSALEPTDDDLNVHNDITVTRTGGSYAQAVADTGPLSILDPPDGVGRYETAVTVNAETDASLGDHAGWRLHLGTVDEARYPQIGVNLARVNFTADPALAAAAAALDVGQRVDIANTPLWLPPDDIRQLAVGFVETLGAYEWTITANCVPASPYVVGVYDSGLNAQYSSDGSTLAAAINSTQVTFDVATPSGPLWMTAAEWTSSGSPSFYIRVGGERMLVGVGGTDGAVSPQQFTVTRSINGVVKSHQAGAVVALDVPAVYAL